MTTQEQAANIQALEPIVFSLKMADPITNEESNTMFAALDNSRVAEKASMVAALHGLYAVSWTPASKLH